MQTLGLQGESKRSDGRLKSIFWPEVENAWDVDYLGRQGFWICLIVAAMQIVFSLASGNPVVIGFGVLEALIFFLGGMGVREGNWPAAALIFSIYLLNLVYALVSRQFPGILSLIATGILLSNVRAAFLASEWKPSPDDTDSPTRFSETFGDKLVDVMPARLWPVLQIPFYALAAVILLISLVGMAFIASQRLGLLSHAAAAQN